MARYSATNLIINYLPQEFSDEDFRALFNSIAPVKRAKICRDKKTGYSYGFGFCEYFDPEDAASAIAMLNGMQLQHKTLKVAYARLQCNESKNCNLHFTNLPDWVSPQDIQSVFAPFGGIINCKVLHDSMSISRGIGFCLFETRSAATTAMQTMNGKPWPGTLDPLIHIRFADENEKKVRPPTTACRTTTAISATDAPPSEWSWSYPFTTYPSTFYTQPLFTTTPFPSHVGIPISYQTPRSSMQEYAVIVDNLTPDCDDVQLYNLFYPFGGVLEASIIRYADEEEPSTNLNEEQQSSNASSTTNTTGVIIFSNYQSAASATGTYNGQNINGHVVQVTLRKRLSSVCPSSAGGDQQHRQSQVT